MSTSPGDVQPGAIVTCTLGMTWHVLSVDYETQTARVEDVATKVVYTAPLRDLTLQPGLSPR